MKLSTFLVSVSLIAALILFRAGMHVSREDAEIHSRPRRSSLLMGTPPSDRHLDPVLSGASQWSVVPTPEEVAWHSAHTPTGPFDPELGSWGLLSSP